MRLDTKLSFNNRLIVEKYTKGELRHKETNGFAVIDQKVKLKGLLVLVDAYLANDIHVPKGSVAYIKEESLHTQAWAQKAYESDGVPAPFLIVDLTNIEFIDPPEEK